MLFEVRLRVIRRHLIQTLRKNGIRAKKRRLLEIIKKRAKNKEKMHRKSSQDGLLPNFKAFTVYTTSE